MPLRQFQVLGPGCMKCRRLSANVEAAAKELGLEYELIKVSDVSAIVGFGVKRTPALIIDGRIAIEGKVATADELKNLMMMVPEAR